MGLHITPCPEIRLSNNQKNYSSYDSSPAGIPLPNAHSMKQVWEQLKPEMQDWINEKIDQSYEKGKREGLDDLSQGAKIDLEQAELKAKLAADLETQKHENELERIQARNEHEKEMTMAVMGGIAQVFSGAVEVYERVQKTKLNAVEARYRMIIELAKIDKDLAKAFIANEGAEVAQAAGEEGAKAFMSNLANVLARGAAH